MILFASHYWRDLPAEIMASPQRRNVWPAFVLLACVSVQAQNTASQANSSAQVPTIKSEANVVLVDVVVTQGKGEPVVGLHKEDFRVREDGRPQTISFFEEHTGGTVSPVVLPEMPPGVFTNYPTIKTTDSINVLLLDSLNTQAIDQTYVRPQMVKYLRAELATPTGARLAIFTLGQKFRMVRGFTAESSANLKALLDPKSGTEAKFEPQMASPWRIGNENRVCDGIRSPAGQAACRDFMADERGQRAGDRVAMTLQAFQALARYLALFPGRKNVMWVAGTFPLSFFPEANPHGGRSKYQSEIRQTADLLTADQVAVYPISATGITGEELTNSDNYGRPVREENSELPQQIAMETLAQETGGKSFYNTNDLSIAMKEAIAIGSHYYTLTYTPSNIKKDGKFRRIEVKGLSGSYKLAYRHGYYTEGLESERIVGRDAASDPLLPFMTFGMPDFAEILYKVRVAAVESNGGAGPTKSQVRYGVDFAIAPQDVKLETSAEGARSGSIEVAVIAYNDEGKALNAVSKRVPIHLQPDIFAALQRVGFQLHEEIDLPSGGTFLETGIYDLMAHHAGTLEIPVEAVGVRGAK